MLSRAEQASLNLEQARALRSSGLSYRDIRRQLAITACQLSHIRRALKREKAARTRLMKATPEASERDLPLRQSVLPLGLRQRLASSGYQTLGDLADALADPDFRGFETIPGVGPFRARLITALLEQHDLLAGPDDLQAAVESLFPEFAPD